MPKFEVSLELVIHAPIKVIVEAANKNAAIEDASGLIAGNIDVAHRRDNLGWVARVAVKPPQGIEVKEETLKASHITQASGGEKARKISD